MEQRPIAQPENRRIDNCVVAMLDVLGARVHSLDDAERIVNAIWKQVRVAEKHVPLMLERANARYRSLTVTGPELRVFGDTIILIWGVEGDLGRAAMMAGMWLQYMFVGGLVGGVPFHGAIATGSILLNDLTALGPAVTGVADYYDATDFLGVVATPRCGEHLTALAEELEADEAILPKGEGYPREYLLLPVFVPYDVPVKQKGDGPPEPEKLWTLAWPELVASFADAAEQTPDEYLRERLNRIPRPASAETKYTNTMDFFKHYHEL